MGLPSDWRSPASADEYAEHDFADFAQEFLRRNPDYRAEFEKGELTAPSEGDSSGTAIAKWGLVFRFRSKTQPTQRTSILATRRGAGRPMPRGGAVAGVQRTGRVRSSQADRNLLSAA